MRTAGGGEDEIGGAIEIGELKLVPRCDAVPADETCLMKRLRERAHGEPPTTLEALEHERPGAAGIDGSERFDASAGSRNGAPGAIDSGRGSDLLEQKRCHAREVHTEQQNGVSAGCAKDGGKPPQRTAGAVVDDRAHVRWRPSALVGAARKANLHRAEASGHADLSMQQGRVAGDPERGLVHAHATRTPARKNGNSQSHGLECADAGD